MLESKLEEIKQNGNYQVQLWYGEEEGCDDSNVPMSERLLIIMAIPVGYLGEVKTFWRGNLDKLETFDFKSKPQKLNNPPQREDIKEDGYYVWGTDRSVDDYLRVI